MTDEELGRAISKKAMLYTNLFDGEQYERLGAAAHTILAARPEVTREAVTDWFNDRYNASASNETVTFILAALSHFAPPPAPMLPRICGMSVEEIEAQMFTHIQEKNRRMEGVLYVQECARVAHHLAQPERVVDPDANARRWMWLQYCGEQPVAADRRWKTDVELWDASAERVRNGWRAVAAKERGE
jgi:hypothetical protein